VEEGADLMIRTKILCPECMKGKLLAESETECYCDRCGTEFVRVAENTVRYKEVI